MLGSKKIILRIKLDSESKQRYLKQNRDLFEKNTTSEEKERRRILKNEAMKRYRAKKKAEGIMEGKKCTAKD